MSTDITLLAYEAHLRAQAQMDREYYRNPSPSAADRADYNRRKEHNDNVRRWVYANQDDKRRPTANPNEIFRVVVNDRANAEQVISDPQCRLTHDLNNCLGIIVGQADLLAIKFSGDGKTLEQLGTVLSAAHKMAELIKTTHCRMKQSDPET